MILGSAFFLTVAPAMAQTFDARGPVCLQRWQWGGSTYYDCSYESWNVPGGGGRTAGDVPGEPLLATSPSQVFRQPSALTGRIALPGRHLFAIGIISRAHFTPLNQVCTVRAGKKFRPSSRLAFTLYAIMAKSLSVKRKKRGRPATGTEPLYGVRFNDQLMSEIMQWAKANAITRSVAIRRLVEQGLKKK
jgi:hypothetical protein